MTKEHGQALLLADSVMEEARARITFSLGRYYGLSDSGTVVKERAGRGAWKSVFTPLAEERRKVVSASPSEISTYFKESQGMFDPIAQRELAAFATQVSVRFDVEGAPIDSDGDGRAETDMCEVEVAVFWRDQAENRERSIKVASLFTREDFDRALEGQ